jgi:N-acetylmuramoyl-L-alanine amidase
MPYHDVKQGETLIGLAVANGIATWNEILDHAENAELKKKRSDPGILKEGDKVFIPNREMRHEAAAVDAKHPFTVSRRKAWIRLALKDAAGAPLAGTYQLTVGSVAAAGSIPASGIVEQAVPVTASSGSLKVVTADGTSEEWELLIGHMDPLDEESGVTARLQNLGFFRADGTLAAAVSAFQQRVGLEVTGVIDDAFREKLKSYYDPAAAEADLDVEPAADDEIADDTAEAPAP